MASAASCVDPDSGAPCTRLARATGNVGKVTHARPNQLNRLEHGDLLGVFCEKPHYQWWRHGRLGDVETFHGFQEMVVVESAHDICRVS